jgi:hypothetical protein
MADGAPERQARGGSARESRVPVGPSPARTSFDGLSTTLVTDDANLREALRRVAILGCELVPLCASSSVTIIERGRAITVGSSSAVAEVLDAAQYDEDDGPCLRAARATEVVRIHDADADDRWPAFCRTAAQHGVFSSLSVPLLLPAAETSGGFNVYGSTANAFSGNDEETCRAFAAQASVVVSNAQAYWAAFELTRHLTTAMESRATIEQAKGVLMSQHGVDADGAFDLLRRRSQTENRKLRDIAREVLDGATGAEPGRDERSDGRAIP